MRTVYYLVHTDSGLRVKYYHTLAGARIAMRLRNHHLGFTVRLHRDILDHREYEQCLNINQDIMRGTYCIEEDVIDTPDLLV